MKPLSQGDCLIRALNVVAAALISRSVQRFDEDTAVVVHRSQAEGRFEGKSFKADHRCTMLCVRRGGEWQVILEQCSPNNP